MAASRLSGVEPIKGNRDVGHEEAANSHAEYMNAHDLEQLTTIPASTWRYWAHIRSGPPSFRIGRRRVWRKTEVLTWIADQEGDAQGSVNEVGRAFVGRRHRRNVQATYQARNAEPLVCAHTDTDGGEPAGGAQ